MKLGHSPRGPTGRVKLPINLKEKNIRLEVGQIVHGYAYKKQETYLIQVLDKEGKTRDIFPVKTLPTIERILSGLRKNDLYPMFLPNPVEIPKEYWEEYRKAKNGYKRIELAKKYGLITDRKILVIKTLVLDIDSPYEKVYPVWEKLRGELCIEKGYQVYRTKSGNLRVYLFLAPSEFEKVWYEVKDGKRVERRKKVFLWERSNTISNNGHTHLENARELLAIIYAFFRKHGLKADSSFVGRINHPIWIEGWEIDGKKSELIEEKRGYAGKLYNLYRKAKELQRQEELWSLGKWNLSEKFWNRKPAEKRETKIKVPSFIASAQLRTLEDMARWKLAVKRLAEKYTSYRFTKVILPAVGWAEYLGLSRHDVENYLRELLPDKENLSTEIEKAYRHGRSLEFEWFGKSEKKIELNLKELTLRFLEEAEEGAPRQFILSEVFGGQNWLLQQVERFCLKEGFLSMERRKLTPGPGRKSYVYVLTEKGKSFVEALRDNEKKAEFRQVVGLETYGRKKSNIQLPSKGEQGIRSIPGQEGVGDCSSDVGSSAGVGARAQTPSSFLWKFSLSSFANNGGKVDVSRKVEGVPRDLVEKHLEDKDPKPKYDPQDPLEKAKVKRALELIGRVEQRWNLELGELPERNYRRLIFGAVRRRGRTYDLGGWGRFAPALGEVLEELGHRVFYPNLGKEPKEEPKEKELPTNEVDLSELLDENGEIPF